MLFLQEKDKRNKSKQKDDVDDQSISDDSISSSSSYMDDKKFRKSSKSFVFGNRQQDPAEVTVNVTPERTASYYDDSTVRNYKIFATTRETSSVRTYLVNRDHFTFPLDA